MSGGRFDFDDGGTYCGGWEDGKAHGHGVCTGPKGQGEYSGSWHFGFEVSGVYTWPSGSTFEGQWQNGKRHGLGVEIRGRWLYRGEWTQGFKGRYGVRQSTTSNAKFEGTWANGLQDGYGSETYADGGTYQGQWLRGMRHGCGVRTSAPFGMASHYRPKTALRASLTSLRSDAPNAGNAANVPSDAAAQDREKKLDDARGGFVLKSKSDESAQRRRSLGEKSSTLKKSILQGLKIRRQRSTGDLEKRGTSASIRSTGSSTSWVSTDSAHSAVTSASHLDHDSNASFVVEDEQLDPNVTETYMGEWKNDKRSGFGISERSDGLRYEGEWYNNKKYGYGVTTMKDGSREEGKYKNNVLVTSQKKKQLFLIRSAKFRERVDAAVSAAQRASKIALQKADIAISRTATARGKSELADISSSTAREDSDSARVVAKQFAPDFHQPGTETVNLKQHIHNIGRAPPPPRPRDESPAHVPTRNTNIMAPGPASKRPSAEPWDGGGAPRGDEAPSFLMPNHMPHHASTHNAGPTSIEVPAQPTTQHNAMSHNNTLNINTLGPSTRQPSVRGEEHFRQAMNDHFDHYKRPPSLSREASQEQNRKTSSRAPSRAPTPANDNVVVRNGPIPNVQHSGSPSHLPLAGSPEALLAELLLQQKNNPSQEVALPIGGGPKRTESLFIKPMAPPSRPPPIKDPGGNVSLRRKKSLPEAPALPATVGSPMSREEVSVLSSARRQEVFRQQEEAERIRHNPLLILTSPQLKEWLSRQQLMMLVLFINISLAIMFVKLLT